MEGLPSQLRMAELQQKVEQLESDAHELTEESLELAYSLTLANKEAEMKDEIIDKLEKELKDLRAEMAAQAASGKAPGAWVGSALKGTWLGARGLRLEATRKLPFASGDEGTVSESEDEGGEPEEHGVWRSWGQRECQGAGREASGEGARAGRCQGRSHKAPQQAPRQRDGHAERQGSPQHP